MPRDQLPTGLRQFSDILPLSYAVDAMKTLATDADATSDVFKDLAVLFGFIVVSLALGAWTLRRRTE